MYQIKSFEEITRNHATKDKRLFTQIIKLMNAIFIYEIYYFRDILVRSSTMNLNEDCGIFTAFVTIFGPPF